MPNVDFRNIIAALQGQSNRPSSNQIAMELHLIDYVILVPLPRTLSLGARTVDLKPIAS